MMLLAVQSLAWPGPPTCFLVFSCWPAQRTPEEGSSSDHNRESDTVIFFCNDLKYFCSFSLNFSAGVWWPGEDWSSSWSPVITGSWWRWHLQTSSEQNRAASPQDGSEDTSVRGAGVHGLRPGLWQPGVGGGGGAADLHQRGRGLPSPQPDLRTPHRPQSLYNPANTGPCPTYFEFDFDICM